MQEYEKLRRGLGRAIKALRASKGYSQEGLAYAVGLNRTYMGDIERGVRNPSLKNLVRISNALGVSLSELISKAEVKVSEEN